MLRNIRLITVFVLSLIVAPGDAHSVVTIAYVQSAQNTNTSGTTITGTLGATANAGNLLIAVAHTVNLASIGAGSVSPGTWTEVPNGDLNYTAGLKMWYKTSDGTETAVTISGLANTKKGIVVAEYSGLRGQVRVFDTENNTNGVGNGAGTGTITPDLSYELLYAATVFHKLPGTGGNCNKITWDAGWTMREQLFSNKTGGQPGMYLSDAEQIVSTGGTYSGNPSCTAGPDTWRAQIAGFRVFQRIFVTDKGEKVRENEWAYFPYQN